MKIKIAKGFYPIVEDGEYTNRHFGLIGGDDTMYYRYDGDLIVPGFAKISINSQEAIIEVSRKDYIVS